MMTTRALAAVMVLTAVTAAGAQKQKPKGGNQPAAEALDAPDPSGFELWKSGRYRLTPSDVLEVTFPYVPEFNQVLKVQPDGYVTLKAVGDRRVQSRTLPELHKMLYDAYADILKEPVITIDLKEFEKPYFIATGQVKAPGKFELRGATTVTAGLALAGGMTQSAKNSQVILFRRYSEDMLEVKEIDVKQMMASRDLSEDHVLRPGDMLYVPASTMSKIKPFIPTSGLSFYLNPLSLYSSPFSQPER